ncbi:MAG: hypothetical protein ACRDH6_04900 [Actinomycetota bacterium]
MPSGRYTVMDGDGNPVGTEGFRCAPGPAGWRYFATIDTSAPEPHRETVDLVVDGDWRLVRLRIETGTHDLELAPVDQGERLVGSLDGEPLELPWGPEIEIDYLSPSFNAVTAKRLGRTEDIDVVFLKPVTCEPIRARQRYEHFGTEKKETPVGTFEAARWQYTALGSGFTRPFWLAGDVVVSYEDVFELAVYEPGSGIAPLEDGRL